MPFVSHEQFRMSVTPRASERLSSLSIVLHWAVAVGMVGMLLYGLVLWLTPSGPEKIALIPLHKSFGVLVGLLAFLRVSLRVYEGFPSSDFDSARPLERLFARWVHITLLLTTVLLPISGIAKSITYARPVAVFGFDIVPKLLNGKNEFWHAAASLTHNVTAILLTILLCVHTGAAIFHHFVRGDTILIRMFRFRRSLPPIRN